MTSVGLCQGTWNSAAVRAGSSSAGSATRLAANARAASVPVDLQVELLLLQCLRRARQFGWSMRDGLFGGRDVEGNLLRNPGARFGRRSSSFSLE